MSNISAPSFTRALRGLVPTERCLIAQEVSHNYKTSSSEFNDNDDDDDDDDDEEQDTRRQLYKPVVSEREALWDHLTKHHCAVPRIQVKSPILFCRIRNFEY